MLYVTDIPDWIICEALGTYDFDTKKTIDADSYSKCYDKSPIKHIDKIKSPVLLMIGSVDLRVPPWQSIEYYKCLLSRDVPTK